MYFEQTNCRSRACLQVPLGQLRQHGATRAQQLKSRHDEPVWAMAFCFVSACMWCHVGIL